MNDPTVTNIEKVGNLQNHVFPSTNLEPLTTQFLSVLYEDGDSNLLSEVVTNFGRLVQDDAGEVLATVTSAHLLSNEDRGKIRTKLNTMVDKGTKITVTHNVDESILGGLIVSIGDKIQDLSVKGAIQKLETDLRML